MTKPEPRITRPPKRQKLSPERIAETALALIDEAGLDSFSFRALAKRLGCQAMSIYHYYPSKAHLFEALVEICLAEIPVPAPDTPWCDGLRGVARAIRQMAIRHPGFFLYFSIFRMNNRAGLSMLDGVLRILEEITPDAERRAHQFRALSYYIMGAGLDEAMGYAHGPSAVDPVPADEAARDFPAIMAIGPYFQDPYHEAIFEYGLEAMLDRIAADTAQPATGNAG